MTCKWTTEPRAAGWQQDFPTAWDGDLPARGSCRKALPIGAEGPLTRKRADLGVTTACSVGVGMIAAHDGGIGVMGGFSAKELDRRLALIAGTSTGPGVSKQERSTPGCGSHFGAMMPGGG